MEMTSSTKAVDKDENTSPDKELISKVSMITPQKKSVELIEEYDRKKNINGLIPGITQKIKLKEGEKPTPAILFRIP